MVKNNNEHTRNAKGKNTLSELAGSQLYFSSCFTLM